MKAILHMMIFALPFILPFLFSTLLPEEAEGYIA